MRKVVFDLETSGLSLRDTIWCASALDLESKEVLHWGPTKIEKFFYYLEDVDLAIGHNICGFDVPLMYSYGFVFPLEKCRDTYIMSKLFYPQRAHHSLESWAPKFGAKKVEHEDWSKYSPEMRIRNEEDVRINAKLYEYLIAKEAKNWPWLKAILLEQEMHYWQKLQEDTGVSIDVEKAEILVEHLDEEIEKIDKELRPKLPKKVVQFGVTIDKPFKKDGTFKKKVEEWFNGEPDGT